MRVYRHIIKKLRERLGKVLKGHKKSLRLRSEIQSFVGKISNQNPNEIFDLHKKKKKFHNVINQQVGAR